MEKLSQVPDDIEREFQMAMFALNKARDAVREFNAIAQQIKRIGYEQFPYVTVNGSSFLGFDQEFTDSSIYKILQRGHFDFRQFMEEGEIECQRKARVRRLRKFADRDGGWVCRYCTRTGSEEADPDGSPWELDHVTPRSKGGSGRLENLCLACSDCNRVKCARTVEELLSHPKFIRNREVANASR